MSPKSFIFLAMFLSLSLIFEDGPSAPSAACAQSHQQNPVYQLLLKEGVPVGAEPVKLAGPTMPDGLSAAEQKEKMGNLGGKNIKLDKFLRESVAAQNVTQTRLKKDGEDSYRLTSFWFVAYGDIEKIKEKSVLEAMLNLDESGNGKAHDLTKEELASRKIDVKDSQREGFGHINVILEKRVDLSLTGRAYYSESKESIITAMISDKRFLDDKDFPNQWKPLKRGVGGKLEAGAPESFDGTGMYLKLTKLKGMEAVFVECHIAMSEPVRWFKGRNYLGSKIPLAITEQVKTMRRALLDASKK